MNALEKEINVVELYGDSEVHLTTDFEHMQERELLAYADELVEQIKDNEEQKEKYTQLANDRIKRINEQLESRVSKLDEWIERGKFNLLQIANLVKTKDTKTQRKLELLTGDVIVKKATTKLKNDNTKILEVIKEERKDLVKEKVTYSLDWAEFKKELDIVDGNIININTGELVAIDGLEIIEVPEIVQVK